MVPHSSVEMDILYNAGDMYRTVPHTTPEMDSEQNFLGFLNREDPAHGILCAHI
jgi:hypothetical protein